MKHLGTKACKPSAVRGYDWYNAQTGAIDLCQLASEATRTQPAPRFHAPPQWLLNANIPLRVERATPIDLARIEARARRAFVRDQAS